MKNEYFSYPMPVATPQDSLSFFSQELRHKASQGVHLEEYLPIESLSVPEETTLRVNGNVQFTLHSCHLFRTIVNFRKWLQAWNRYKQVVISENYTLHHGLVMYQELKQNCDKNSFDNPCTHTTSSSGDT